MWLIDKILNLISKLIPDIEYEVSKSAFIDRRNKMTTKIVKGFPQQSIGKHRIERLQTIGETFEYYHEGSVDLELVLDVLIHLCESDEEFYRAIESNGLQYDPETKTLTPKEVAQETQTRKD